MVSGVSGGSMKKSDGYPGGKDHVGSWLQCKISRYLAFSTVVCGSRSITPGSLVTMSVIEREKWDNGVSTVNEVCSGPRSRMLQPRF